MAAADFYVRALNGGREFRRGGFPWPAIWCAVAVSADAKECSQDPMTGVVTIPAALEEVLRSEKLLQVKSDVDEGMVAAQRESVAKAEAEAVEDLAAQRRTLGLAEDGSEDDNVREQAEGEERGVLNREPPPERLPEPPQLPEDIARQLAEGEAQAESEPSPEPVPPPEEPAPAPTGHHKKRR